MHFSCNPEVPGTLRLLTVALSRTIQVAQCRCQVTCNTLCHCLNLVKLLFEGRLPAERSCFQSFCDCPIAHCVQGSGPYGSGQQQGGLSSVGQQPYASAGYQSGAYSGQQVIQEPSRVFCKLPFAQSGAHHLPRTPMLHTEVVHADVRVSMEANNMEGMLLTSSMAGVRLQLPVTSLVLLPRQHRAWGPMTRPSYLRSLPRCVQSVKCLTSVVDLGLGLLCPRQAAQLNRRRV